MCHKSAGCPDSLIQQPGANETTPLCDLRRLTVETVRARICVLPAPPRKLFGWHIGLISLASSERQQSDSVIYEHKVFEIIDDGADGCARESRVGAMHRRMHQVQDLSAGITATSYYVPVAERLMIQCSVQLGSAFDLRARELCNRQHPAVNIYRCIR